MKHFFLSVFLMLTIMDSAQAQPASLEVLPPEQAFQLEYQWTDTALQLHWQVAPDHYLYLDKFRFSSSGALIENVDFPEGKVIDDPFFGPLTVFYDDFSIALPLSNIAPIAMTYQGCAVAGFCYEPVTVLLSPDGPVVSQISAPPQGIAQTFEHSFYWILISFFGFGLLLSLTPCVLPMVPILSGILVGQKRLSTGKAFRISALYVLSMAASYAVFGMVAARLGQTLQSMVQSLAVTVAFSGLLILMTFILFDWIPFSLRTPEWVTRCQRRAGNGPLGIIMMGALATLVSSPCVTAPLVGALTFIAQTQNQLLGGSALFMLGLGMGFPLLVFGTLGGTLLPKAGPWMRHINTFVGLGLLGLALWLVLPFALPSTLLWGASVIALMTAMRLPVLWRPLLIFLALLWGWGAWHEQARLDYFLSIDNHAGDVMVLPEVKSVADLQAHFDGSKPAVLFVHADWCTTCQHIKHQVLAAPELAGPLSFWKQLSLDITHISEGERQLMAEYELFAPPVLLFFSPDGQEIKALRIVADTKVSELAGHLVRGTVQSGNP